MVSKKSKLNLVKWQKGHSGNPSGRGKKIPVLETLLAELLGEEEDGVTSNALVILKALLKKAKKGDVRAAEVLLDRA